MKIKSYISIFFFAFLIGLTNCKEDNNEMTGIALDKETVTINVDISTTVIPYPVPWDAEVSEKFTWTSENTAVAKVNSKGQILGVDPGETNIICHYQDLTATVKITVNTVETLNDKINSLGAKGYWEFEDASNLTKKTIGNDLVFVEDNKKITSIDGPRFDNKAVRVPWDPKSAGVTGTFIKCIHGLQPKNGEEKINEYTIMWDIRLPDETGMPETGYYTLMSARTLDNSKDQDFAIKSSGSFGIGDLGYSTSGSLKKGKWHRVVLAAKAGSSFTYYVDGSKVYSGNAAKGSIDGRYSLLPEGVLFFSDDDGDDSTIDASAIAIWDKQLAADEVKKLGDIRQTVDFQE
jgi:hypothetical protein